MGKAKAEAAVSIGVILTITASGSESSVVSVILNEKDTDEKRLPQLAYASEVCNFKS